MADPVASFSGLATGIQWRDMVDQIMQIETARKLTPITDKSTAAQKRADAWGSFSTLAGKFRDALKTLRDGTAIGQFKVSAGTTATGRTLFAATAGTSAAPGSYKVEVLDLARANKLSGDIVASASGALGLTGEFAINGRRVTVSATDSLSAIRDRINSLNTGASPSGVSATILSTGPSAHRLVLTSETTGAAGIQLVDGDTDVLASLGVVQSSTTLNQTESGGAQTYRVSSATAAIATMLGVTLPPPASIEIGGRTISVDLSVDSLTTIAARIQAAGGTAEVVSDAAGGRAGHSLVTSGTVSASTPEGQRTLEVLGFMKPDRGAVSQVVRTENQYTDAGGVAATASTLLTDLQVAGASLGLAVGDTFSVRGTRGDGTAVSLGFAIGASDTLQTVVDRINDAASGFGYGSRTAVASVEDGRIVLADAQGGDSQLSLALSATQSGGGTVSMGRTIVETTGRLREVVAGSDARVRVDGVLLSRATNTISDAIAGVGIDLQQAEPGAVVSLGVARDADAVAKTVGDVAAAYNELLKFVSSQRAADAPLRNNAVLRSALASITNTLLSDVTGATGLYDRTASVGLSLQKDGNLTLDLDAFKKALASNPADVAALFATGGKSSAIDLEYAGSGFATPSGDFAVEITAAATKASVAGVGFAGAYSDDGTADTMTIADALSGATANVSLEDGDTLDEIVDRLNAAFAASKMSVAATKVGGQLVLAGTQHGSAASFTVSYAGGGADGSAQLGLAAGTYAGTDVAGSIGGTPATGSGQTLTAPGTSAANGLSVRYTGTSTGAVGTISFTLGAAGALARASDAIARGGDGVAATQQETLGRTITSLKSRADTVQQQLDRRRQALIAQYVAMEAAISRIQSQGSSLSGFIASLQQRND